MRKFNTLFLEEVVAFLETLDAKPRAKIIFNIDKAAYLNDPKLFKKLTGEIWEFRTAYGKLQYRLLAFWDKRDNRNVLVVCTHGILKKTDKVPAQEIAKANNIRTVYLGHQ